MASFDMVNWAVSPLLYQWLQAAAPLMIMLAIGVGGYPILNRMKSSHRLLVIGLSLVVIARYHVWRIEGLMNAGDLFAWLVYGVELLGLIEAALSMLMMLRIADRKKEADLAEHRLRTDGRFPLVDVFIPTYNEGLEVLEKSIVGALAIEWPADRLNVWVLDDGKRDWLREFCHKKGARYLVRENNDHAKAGNINAALKHTQGEFIAVFDADFVPQKKYLMRTIGLFSDGKIGCVQTPHHFYNADPVQANLLMNGMMPDDQRLFFDVVMPSRDAWDAAFCCGSCGVLRRSAVEAIGGGIPTSSVTEDILTTLAMKRAGFITRYLNEKLAFGLAAESVEAFFVQRERWGRGGIQLMFLREGPFGPGLRMIDRLLFFPASWIAQYTIRVFGFALPVLCLWAGASPMPGADTFDVICYQGPFLLAFYQMTRWLAPNHHIPLLTTAAQCFASFRLAPAMIVSLIKPFGTPFRVTPKGKANGGLALDKRTMTIAGIMMACTIAGLVSGIGDSGGMFPVLAFWCLWNCTILGIVMLICVEVPRRRGEERVSASDPIVVRSQDGLEVRGTALDYSLSGAKIFLEGVGGHRQKDICTIEMPDVGGVSAEVVGAFGSQLRVRFTDISDEARDRLIVKIFASGLHENGIKEASVRDLLSAAWNRFFGRTWLEASR